MGLLKRWYANIKWLLNRPPTSMVTGDWQPCDYCGKRGLLETPEFKICTSCIKKALDKCLKE